MKKINNGFANEKPKEKDKQKDFATEKQKRTKSNTFVRDTSEKKN